MFEGPAVGVEGVLLSIDSDCEVVIESFNSPGCGDRDEENTNTTTSKWFASLQSSAENSLYSEPLKLLWPPRPL